MLHAFFFNTANHHPHRPALCVNGRSYSYGDMQARARRVAGGLRKIAAPRQDRYCLLFAQRSVAAYAGLLGILDAGMAYVPLSPKVPPARIAAIIKACGARLMLVDHQCAAHLQEVFDLLAERPQVFLLDDDTPHAAPPALGAGDLPPPLPAPATAYEPHAASPQDIAYVLFTSGSTGTPKGVTISHASADAYISSWLPKDPAPVLTDARYAQFCDLTFDPSVHDMFVCWANAGCLYVPKTVEPLYNAGFIRDNAITHWSSVPSVAGFMQQFRKLAPNEFPSLRVTLFGGEALPPSLVAAWLQAAPHTQVINLYGPTEATVACTRFAVTPEFLGDSQHTVVPLGRPAPGQAVEVLLVDADLEPVAAGQTGELLIGGPQVATGYLAAEAADHARFVTRSYPGYQSGRWYRSGDAACESDQYGLLFRGRIDMQVKIRGNRIELEEVEHVVQRCSGAALCAVIAAPRDTIGRPAGLVAFVLRANLDAAQVLQLCRQQLPPYAVPTSVIALEAFPLNVNGKIDRRALEAMHARTIATV